MSSVGGGSNSKEEALDQVRYDGGTVEQDVRKNIPPHLLRYFAFAMCMALRDEGWGMGIFRLCEKDVADILGEPLRLIGGRRRVSPRAMERVERAFRDLSEIRVDRIGSVQAGKPETLMQNYGPRYWAPSTLALLACKGLNDAEDPPPKRPEHTGEGLQLLHGRCEQKSERAQRDCMKVPQDITRTVVEARSGGTSTTGMHAEPIAGTPYTGVRLTKEARVTVLLPVPFDDARLGQDVRREFSAGMLRAFALLNALSQRQGHPHGLVHLTQGEVAELCGVSLHEYKRTRRDRGAERTSTERRPHQRLLERVEKQLERLSRVYVQRIGTMEAGQPEPLVQRDAARGKRWWKPSTLVYRACVGIDAKTDNAGPGGFIQQPLGSLRLEADDAALAIGIATVVRADIHNAERRGGGRIRSTLENLLPRIGWCMDRRRAMGRRFWTDAAERLVRVAAAADLGEVMVVGTGPEAEVFIIPSKLLRDAYSDAVEKSRRRVDLWSSRGEHGLATLWRDIISESSTPCR